MAMAHPLTERTRRGAIDLRRAFVESAQEHLRTRPIRLRLRYFADECNSFEGWLNWELAFAFSSRFPWPEYVARREHRFPKDRSLGDIVLYQGHVAPPAEKLVRIETKLIWNNKNRSKQVRFAVADGERIALSGHGVLTVVAVGANQPNDYLRIGSSDEILGDVESLLPRTAVKKRAVLHAEDIKPSPEFEVAPSIRIVAYPVG
jgi:hypothetical protein